MRSAVGNPCRHALANNIFAKASKHRRVAVTLFDFSFGWAGLSSLLEDDALARQGRALALNGHYESALEALMAVGNKNDATVLTYIGYATRKLGNIDEGIAWYHKALALDPDNVYTHEYLGEGYVAAGRIDLAEQELARLEALCGKGCEQYEALSAAIAGEPENWGG